MKKCVDEAAIPVHYAVSRQTHVRVPTGKQPIQVGGREEGRGHRSLPEEVVLEQGPQGWDESYQSKEDIPS